jgi:hypothetical protein
VYLNCELVAYSEKWTAFDLAFEYRVDSRDEWQTDAVISSTSASYLKGNRLFGLASSQYGETHTIQWKYSANDVLFGTTPQIRIRILPRARIFGSSTLNS